MCSLTSYTLSTPCTLRQKYQASHTAILYNLNNPTNASQFFQILLTDSLEMPQLSFVTLDVFTRKRFAGNPLAVVRIPSGQDVSTEQMQAIAREFNLSETLFLHEGQSGEDGITEWRVRIFVTTAEIPFAGHPTIGASCYALGTLANNAKKGRLICNAGPIEVDYADGVAKASIPHNFHRHVQHEYTAEQIYGLHPSLKKAARPPKSIDVVSPVKGMNFVCIELSDLETLGLVDTSGPYPELPGDEGWAEGLWGSFLYVVTDESNDKVEVRTRMLQASLEDPATGSASCGLSALLATKMKLGRKVKFEITQGVEMGRQSDIGVSLTLKDSMDGLESVVLRGSSVKVMEGVVEYD